MSNEQVAQVRIARWHAWDRLAAGLPDGYVLSVELLHSRADQAIAVFTVVTGHKAVQSIVGDQLQVAAAVTATDPASSDAVAIGEPPPKQPAEPGLVAQGTSLLATAFGKRQPAAAK